MKSLGYIENCNWSKTEKKKEEERKKLSEILPNVIMLHIQGKSGSAKFTKSHTVNFLVHVFEQTSSPSTKRKNELRDDLRAMEEHHPDLLMEAVEKFAYVERIFVDVPNQATTITTGPPRS